MSYLGEFNLGDAVPFFATTHNTTSGAAVDAATAPTWRTYAGVNSAVVQTGSMALLDENNTSGFYGHELTVSTGNGYGVGTYAVYKEATVGGITGVDADMFRIVAPKAEGAAVSSLDARVSSAAAQVNSGHALAVTIEARVVNLPNSGALTSLAQAAALTVVDNEISSLQAAVNAADAVADLVWARVQNLPNSGSLTSLATGAAVASLDARVTSGAAVGDLTWARVQNLPNSGTLSGLTGSVATVDSEVGSLQASVNSIDARAIAHQATTDLVWTRTQNLPNSGALTGIANQITSLDTRVSSVAVEIGSLTVSASSLHTRVGSLATQVGSVDTRVGGVSSKTSQLTFTDTAVDANVVKVNSVTVTGAGTSGNEWGPA